MALADSRVEARAGLGRLAQLFAQTQQQLNPVQPWISAAVEISRLVKTAQMPSSEVDAGIPQQSRCKELITL